MRIVVMGPAGKVGRNIVSEALKRRKDFMIVGGVVPEGNEFVRLDMGKAIGEGFVGATLYDDLEFCIPIAQAVIDFTNPEATMKTLKKCIEYRRPLVIGTTGFNEKQVKDLEYAAKKIPLILAEKIADSPELMAEMSELAGVEEATADVSFLAAIGGLEGALFLNKRKPGIYTFKDVINFSHGIEPEVEEEETLFDGGIELW